MAGADGDTPAAAAERLMARADRLRDLSAPLSVFAASCETRVSDAFRAETSPAGEKWPPLAESTLKARAAKLPGANRRGKTSGQLTRGAREKRLQGRLSPGAIKILIDTGRLRQGIAVRVVDGASLEFTGPLYMRTHVQGDPDRSIPKRNPLPLEVLPGGELKLVEDADRELRELLVAHIDGRAA